MRYGLIMKQAGDGCDHTIACGTRVEYFDADDRRAAVSHTRRFLQGRDAEDGDRRDDCWLLDERGEMALASATLVEASIVLPIHDWYRDVQVARADAAHAVKMTAERETLRKLLAKHGNPGVGFRRPV